MDSISQIALPNEDEADDSLSTILFTTIAQLFREVNRSTGDALIVKSISPEAFSQLEKARERNGRKIRFSLYDPETQTLIITIPHGPHEALHSALYITEIFFEIGQIGLRYNWKHTSSKLFLPRGSNGGRRGEGDSGGGPNPERRDPHTFPTLVIEAGYSQSLRSLRQKARFWFDISNHDIKIVILAKLYRNRGIIILEKWQEGPSHPRSGATTTRSMPPLEASCYQTIVITKIDGNPPTFQVTSGDLVLSFRLLFLREPRQGESDIIVTVPKLQLYAEEVWTEVG